MIILILQDEADPLGAMEDKDDEGLQEIGYEIAIPQPPGRPPGDGPHDGYHGQREGKGDEQRHAVMTVELIDDHEHIDVAEGDEAEGEDAQGSIRLGDVTDSDKSQMSLCRFVVSVSRPSWKSAGCCS